MTTYNRFIYIANRLGIVKSGGPNADRIIHAAIEASGPVPLYTSDETAARQLLPVGFKWLSSTHAGGRFYAACARAGVGANGLPMPHHGAWAATEALAICRAAMRARAALVKG